MIDLKQLACDMGELRQEEIMDKIKGFLQESHSMADIFAVIQALTDGMKIVSDHFDNFHYFVGDLIYAGNILTEATYMLTSHLRPEISACFTKRTVLLCTVEGDLHDIGKNIVKAVLNTKNIQVVDLGVNVSPETIVREAQDRQISIILLSGVLTLAVDSMKRTIESFQNASCRKKIHIIVGGSCINQKIADSIGADFYAALPEETAVLCCSLLEACS